MNKKWSPNGGSVLAGQGGATVATHRVVGPQLEGVWREHGHGEETQEHKAADGRVLHVGVGCGGDGTRHQALARYPDTLGTFRTTWVHENSACLTNDRASSLLTGPLSVVTLHPYRLH